MPARPQGSPGFCVRLDFAASRKGLEQNLPQTAWQPYPTENAAAQGHRYGAIVMAQPPAAIFEMSGIGSNGLDGREILTIVLAGQRIRLPWVGPWHGLYCDS